MPSRTALDGPNGFSEAPGPRRFFGKFEIGRSITKSSLASVAHKAKKGVGGWGGGRFREWVALDTGARFPA